ncbi:MAG: acyl-[acyl-carrier-protein] thioesterase [Anaerovoracaceae bacterium]
MKYSFESKVRYSEVDYNQNLKLNTLIDYFQDCSTFQSETLGVGLDYMDDNHQAWLLASWQIVIKRLPKFNEDIKITTWPYEFKSVYGMRNYIMQDSEENYLAYANSIWVMVDTSTGKIFRPDEHQHKSYILSPKLDMEYAPRKIKISGEPESLHNFYVENHHLDTNGHVNNGQYVLMAKDCIPETADIHQLRVEYKISAMAGDLIQPVLYRNEDSYIVDLTDGYGKSYAVTEFK